MVKLVLELGHRVCVRGKIRCTHSTHGVGKPVPPGIGPLGSHKLQIQVIEPINRGAGGGGTRQGEDATTSVRGGGASYVTGEGSNGYADGDSGGFDEDVEEPAERTTCRGDTGEIIPGGKWVGKHARSHAGCE